MITKAPFLPLAVILAFLGTSIAFYDGFFHLGHALLACLGIIVGHVSVNVFNEYFDYKSGIDLHTKPTPFSGGSGAMPQGLFTEKQALWLGVITFAALIPIGVYFLFAAGWMLLPLLVVAAFCILLYSPVILRRYWPEWSPGVGLGVITVLGVYFVLTGEYNVRAVVATIPSFILVHNLLLLNEFPDIAADIGGGRKTTPITWGTKKAAGLYAVMTVLVYVALIAGVLTGQMPAPALLGLLTIPIAVKAIRGSQHYDDMERFLPAMSANVQVVLFTQLLTGIGYVVSRILGIGLLWQ